MWRSPVLVLQLLLVLVLLPSLAAAASSSAAAGVTTKGETKTRQESQGFRGLADRSTSNNDDDEPSLKSPKKSEKKKKREKKEEELPEVVVAAPAITSAAPSPAPKAKPGAAVMTYVESHESVVAEDLEGLEEKVEHSSGESRIVTIFGFVLLLLGCGFGYKYYQDRQSSAGPVYTTIP
jgi:hypothetical protein